MRTFLSIPSLTLIAFSAAASQQPRTITFDDFSAVRGVGDPQPSPDGRLVLYAVRTTDVSANSRASHTYVLSVGGGSPRPFPSADVAATEARWSPDGKRIAYVSGGQLWIADASGGARKQLTDLNGGATGPIWSPNSDKIAFTSAVYFASCAASGTSMIDTEPSQS
jgi:dipeptidyl aminopeptidase/acylaminoacyl peptidase